MDIAAFDFTPTYAEVVADRRGHSASGFGRDVWETRAISELPRSGANSKREARADVYAPTSLVQSAATPVTQTQLTSDGRESRAIMQRAHSNLVEQTASQRIRVLAIKYAGGPLVNEAAARAEILGARLGRYAPRVDDAITAALAADRSHMTALSSELDDLIRSI